MKSVSAARLPFVVTGPGADRIDRPAIALGLRVDLGIAVDLAGRGLQHLGAAALGHAQHVDRPHHRGLHGLDGVVLVVARRGRAGQIVDLVHFQPDRQGDVVADQLEVGPVQEVATLDFWLVKKLSRQITSWPCSTSRSQRCEPRNPAPPVTRIRFKECHRLGPLGSLLTAGG